MWGIFGWASLVAQMVICLQCGRPGFNPWIGKIPWRRERLPTPVFWPREFYELYSPWGHKESDMTEWLSLHFTSSLFFILFSSWLDNFKWSVFEFTDSFFHLIKPTVEALYCMFHFIHHILQPQNFCFVLFLWFFSFFVEVLILFLWFFLLCWIVYVLL